MTKNQKSALSEANVQRSREAAHARILKSLEDGKIDRGRAVLLLVAHAGLKKNKAVKAVSEADED